MSERVEQSVKYWTKFCIHLPQGEGLKYRLPSVKARKRHFIDFPMGTYILRAAQRVRRPVLDAGFILKGCDATTYFEALQEQQAEIHSECGEPLVWEAHRESEKCIVFLKEDTDVRDEKDWPNQHKWIVRKFEILNEVFRPRIENLVGFKE